MRPHRSFPFLVAAALALHPLDAVPLLAGTNTDPCIQGYVWREAFPGDYVCVTPQVRAQTAADNAQAAARRAPGGGAYGRDTCRRGYVWRAAHPEDRVCVTPATRAQAAADNAQARMRTTFKGDVLHGGSALQARSAEFLRSRNRLYKVVMQGDCNLILYNPDHLPLWSSATAGRASGCYAEMQTDGNLVVYGDGRNSVWSSETEGNPGARAVLQDDGNFVVYHGGRPLWATDTPTEVLTDRCSGDVFISSRYDPAHHPSTTPWGGMYLTRAQRGETDWSYVMQVDQPRIRWWCNSTTGNWADPGTWRVTEGKINVGCTNDAAMRAQDCKPGGGVGIGSSAVEGWTPEQSVCPATTRRIVARLGHERLLQIQCYR